MLHLLNNVSPTSRHRIVLPRLTYVRNGMLENLNKTITYNRNYPQYLPNDHLLVRLMYLSPMASLSGDPRRLLEVSKELIPQISTSLQVTSETRAGRTHNPGYFYGLGVNEIVVLFSEDFDIHADWRELRPVEPWMHPFTQVSLQIPDGKPRGDHDGNHAVVGINFPMLMWMFKCWLDSDESWMMPDVRYNLTHFLKMWVLPNMLHRHQEWVWFNRLRYIISGKSLPDDNYRHSFFQVDYRKALDDNLVAWNDRVNVGTLDFGEMIGLLPHLQEDAFSTFNIPRMMVSRMNRWALLTARWPVFEWLLGYVELVNSRRNLGEKRRMYGEIRRMLRDKNYEGGFNRGERAVMKKVLEDQMKRLL